MVRLQPSDTLFHSIMLTIHHKAEILKVLNWFSLQDYDTLRTTGVILAAIMFVSGIVIALSK